MFRLTGVMGAGIPPVGEPKRHLFMKRLLLLSALAGLFLATSCSPSEENGGYPLAEFQTLSCSDAPLDSDGVLSAATLAAGSGSYNGTIYTEDVAQVQGYYDEGDSYPWGFVVSNNRNTQTYGDKNRYSVYSVSQIETSPVFLAGFYDPGAEADPDTGEAGRAPRVPTILFTQPVSVTSLLMTNTTQAYRYWTGSDLTYHPSVGVDNDCNLVITGYRDGVPTKAVSWPLAQRDSETGESIIVNTWCSVDLGSLGLVDKLTFVVGTDEEHVVRSFCIDNIAYVKL